jgi:hypothetical protein
MQPHELAYPVGHPKHPDFKGVATETHTTFGFDFADDHAGRGGQGQPVQLEPGTEATPREGFRHLFGLPLGTLAEAEKAFSGLDLKDQKARLEWNEKGIPAAVLQGE